MCVKRDKNNHQINTWINNLFAFSLSHFDKTTGHPSCRTSVTHLAPNCFEWTCPFDARLRFDMSLLFYCFDNFSTDCSPLNNKNLIYASKHLEHLEQTWTSLNVTYCNNQFVLKSVTFCTLSPSDLCLCLFFSSSTDNCFLMEPKDSYQMQSKLCLATIVAEFDCAKTTNTVNRGNDPDRSG